MFRTKVVVKIKHILYSTFIYFENRDFYDIM